MRSRSCLGPAHGRLGRVTEHTSATATGPGSAPPGAASSGAGSTAAASSTRPGGPGTTTVTVRYWAAARAAAGVDQEERDPGSVADILAGAVADHPDLRPVLAVASTLVDGVAVTGDGRVAPGSTVEILPPFAGG